MLKYILPLVLLVYTPSLAQASSWVECQGTGEVQKVQQQEDGTYQLEVRVVKATVTDGMGATGGPCFFGLVPIIAEIPSPESFDIGAVVPLKYSSYSGMGAEGPVSSQTWSLLTEE